MVAVRSSDGFRPLAGRKDSWNDVGKADQRATNCGNSMSGARPRFDLTLLIGVDEAGSSGQAEWLRVFKHFNPRLRGYFVGRVDDGDELDDLISEIWRRVMLNVHRLRSPNAFWSWMVQIGVNLLRDLGRQGVRQSGRRMSLESLSTAELGRLVVPRLSEEADGVVDNDSLKEALEELPPIDRELLELHVIDELTHAEISTRLNLSGAVASRKRLQRIKSHLLSRLLGAIGENHPHEGRAQEDER